MYSAYSASDLVDSTSFSESYLPLLGNNILIYRTYRQYLTDNSGESGCYTSYLTVKYGEWGAYASLLTDKYPHQGII